MELNPSKFVSKYLVGEPKKSRQVFPTVTQSFLNKVRTYGASSVFYTKISGSWKSLTWLDFYNEVRSISLGLIDLGIKDGDRISILSNTRLEWQIADMGIMGAKAITVPIYSSNTDEDCKYILNHAEVRVLFVEDQKQLEKIEKIRADVPTLEKIVVFNPMLASAAAPHVTSFEELKRMGRKAAIRATLSERVDEKSIADKKDVVAKNLLSTKPTDTFTICYTSGTTGTPKGVVLTFDNLTSVIEDIEVVMGGVWSEKDVILSFLPISHIFGKVESMAVYHFGWKMYFAENIDKLFQNIGEVRPTLLFAVPRIFEKAHAKVLSTIDSSAKPKQILFERAMKTGRAYHSKLWRKQIPSLALFTKYQFAKKIVFAPIYEKFGGRLRMCIAGGAPLSKEIGEFMQIVGVSVLEGYGLTETCAPVTLNPFDAPKFGSIGKPLPEVAMKIAPDGEILVKSRKVFKGYFRTDDKPVLDDNGWFHTGDIGDIDEEGYVRITDRKKDLIVTSGGKNIAPQKIENLIKAESKFISQIVVHGDRRNYLVALVVLEKDEVIRYARENNILFSEYHELVKNPKISVLAQRAIDQVNLKLPNFETIKKFKVLSQDFTVETGELTPSLKVKRKYCDAKFKVDIDSMYEEPQPN